MVLGMQPVEDANITEAELVGRIARKDARVAIFGLGYVGLPLAVAKAKAGFKVVGIDRNPDRVASVA